jgi:hypothetical protein
MTSSMFLLKYRCSIISVCCKLSLDFIFSIRHLDIWSRNLYPPLPFNLILCSVLDAFIVISYHARYCVLLLAAWITIFALSYRLKPRTETKCMSPSLGSIVVSSISIVINANGDAFVLLYSSCYLLGCTI